MLKKATGYLLVHAGVDVKNHSEFADELKKFDAHYTDTHGSRLHHITK